MSPPAGDPCSASPERPHVALDRSLTRASDQSTKDLQRSHLIGQQKELRAAIEAMRSDLQALPSRTAQQRLLEAESSLAELDAIYSAQNRNAEALLNIPGSYSESHKRAVMLIQWAWRERQLRRAMEAERRPFLDLIGLPALSWRSLTGGSTGGGGGGGGVAVAVAVGRQQAAWAPGAGHLTRGTGPSPVISTPRQLPSLRIAARRRSPPDTGWGPC